MKTRFPLLLLLIGATNVLLLAPSAGADDISFTYVEAAAVQIDPDGGSSEQGYRVDASLGLPLNLYGFARWENADTDDFQGDLDAAEWGIGWHLGLGDTVQGLIEAAYVDRQQGLFDEDGYAVNLGVRFRPLERWEFGVKAGYRDLDANLEGGFGEAYGMWQFWGLLGLTARAELAEDGNRFGVGLRASF